MTRLATPVELPQVVWGRTGLHVSALGLGCSRLGSTLAGLTEGEAKYLVQHAVGRGVTLFDTADIYGQGASERLLGAALAKQRPNVVLVSKAGQRFTVAQRAATLFKAPVKAVAARLPVLRAAVSAQRAQALPRDYTPAHIEQAIKGTLRRLNTDWLDVFMLHSPSAADVQEGACFALLDRLREQGVIRHWGVSCDDLATAEAALRVPGVSALQIPLLLARAAPSLVAEAARLRTALLVREMFAAPTLSEPGWRQRRVGAGLALPNAAALIGTTCVAHLDEALSGLQGVVQPQKSVLERPG